MATIVWPRDAANRTYAQVKQFMTDTGDEKTVGKISKDELKNGLFIEGDGLSPIEGGADAANATVLAPGPQGQLRKREASPGFYSVSGNIVEAEIGKRWVWGWNYNEWMLYDMGELPKTDTSTLATKQELEVLVSKKDLFDEGGKNLFNPDAEGVAKNTFLTNTGALAGNSPTYHTTDFIFIGKEITEVSISFARFIAFFNLDKTYVQDSYLSISPQGQTTISKPAVDLYVRASVPFTQTSGIYPWDVLMINEGGVQLPYEPYVEPKIKEDVVPALPIADNSVTETKIANASVSADKIKSAAVSQSKLSFALIVSDSKNLFNPNASDVTLNSFLGSTGATTPNSNTYHTSGFIKLDRSVSTQIRFSHHRFSAFYDVNKAFIQGSYNNVSAVNTVRDIPVNAEYARVTVAFTLSAGVYPWAILMVNHGTANLPYQPYQDPYYVLENTKSALNREDEVLVFLPSEICIAVGRTIELYNNQVIWTGNINNYHVSWTGVGKNMKRKWTMTGTSANIGSYALTIRVYDNNMKQVGTAQTTVRIVSNVLANPLILCMLGDSLMNGKPQLAELIALSGGKISYQGTRGPVQNAPNRTHEGRSGAAASFYIGPNSYGFDQSGQTGNDGRTQDLNPFWNPNKPGVDWAYYKSNYNKNPDKLVIWLGTNNIALDPTNNVNSIKVFIDELRSTGCDKPIFVVFTLFRGNQDGIGNQLGTDGYTSVASWKLEEDRKVFNLQMALYDALKDYTSLYFIPVSLCHDSEYNFTPDPAISEAPWDEPKAVNPRSWQKEYIASEGTHPQLAGYNQIADIMYSALCAHQK